MEAAGLQVSTEGTSWVKGSCLSVCPNKHKSFPGTLQPDVFWLCLGKELILTLQKPLEVEKYDSEVTAKYSTGGG